MLLGRLGGQMLLITLVLFTLSAYHSPTLAGLTAFFAVFPGLLISPVLGALLDRHRRARLIGLDYLLAGISLSLLAFLSTRSLPQALLLLIVALASLTNPLSSTGTRSLFPLVAPVPLWERANAIDSATYIISILLGAPLAASLFATLGAPVALAVSALVFVGAAACLVRLREPSVAPPSVSLLHQSWQGLAYVVRHPTLRGLALVFTTFNLSWGILVIAIPVIVINHLHSGPAPVGWLWAAMGMSGLTSAFFVGRLPSLGRERTLIFAGILLSTLAIVLLPLATSLLLVAAAIILYGLANGPLDIGLITLRQRTTDPKLFGRAFAVSMSINWVGAPIGSALAGFLIPLSLNFTLFAAAVTCLLAAALALLAIPTSAKASSPLPIGQAAS